MAMLLVKLTVFESGIAPPRVCENDREEGAAVRTAATPVSIKKLTGTVMVVLPPEIVMMPELMPVINPVAAPLTATVKVAGAAVLELVTVSQSLFDVVVKEVEPPVTERDCVGGAVPPTVC